MLAVLATSAARPHIAMPSDDEIIDGAPADPRKAEPQLAGHEEAATAVVETSAPATSRNPWKFVPFLYFLQGVPVITVQQLSQTMMTKMGVGAAEMAVWSNLLKLPWTIKPFWGPLVDLNGRKRNWIVLMQALIFIGLLASALVMTSQSWFTIIIITFAAVAFLSATHDIAADGFYLLALEQKDQSFFVGIRSASFRLATVFCTGGLVYIAGEVEDSTKNIPRSWFVALLCGALVYGVFALVNAFAMPRPKLDAPPVSADPAENWRNVFRTLVLVLWATLTFYLLSSLMRLIGHGLFLTWPQSVPGWNLAGKDGAWPNEPTLTLVRLAVSGVALPLVTRWLRGLLASTDMGMAMSGYFRQHKIMAILGFIMFYRFGESMIGTMASTFMLNETAKGGLALHTKSVGFIWGTVGVVSLIAGGLLGGILISKYGIKKCLWPMVLALNIPNLAYVWAAVAQPISPANELIMNAPEYLPVFSGEWFSHLGSVLAAVFQDPVGWLISIDQFGYGFGFSAYLVYLMFVSQGTTRFQTSHYAISTGLMSLGAMFAGAISGSLQEALGYQNFFITVCVLTIPGMITLFFIPMDREDMKVKPVELD